jgi:DNA-binding MarR family transcriptional regulator
VTTNAVTIPEPTAPAAGARTLALAHYAARGVLEYVLARHDLTFPQQVTLRAAVTAEAAQTPEDLVAEVHGSLKADPADVRVTVDELLAKGLLVTQGPHIRPTEAGRALMEAVSAETGPVTARVWGGIPAADLAVVGRVLALVTDRANAELAALTV